MAGMTDPNEYPNITRQQAVLIASRVIAIYLLFWAFDDLTLLPHVLLPVAHYMQETGSVPGANTRLPQTTYFLRYYTVEVLGNILRIAVALMAAGWFYRCGPRISAFFAPGQNRLAG
jgi:hypothetical protein